MNMASHAERVVPSNPNEKSTYTVSSRQILELMSRYTRLFNLLTYASFTRSHRPILTPRGLRRLVERGLMTGKSSWNMICCTELNSCNAHFGDTGKEPRAAVFLKDFKKYHFHFVMTKETQWESLRNYFVTNLL